MTLLPPRPYPPSPYPQRTEHLPWDRADVTADWLGRTMANKYPGLAITSMTQNELFDSHTTKMRVTVAYNEKGAEYGLPNNLCLKSNWSGAFADVDICEIEARFYQFIVPHMKVPTATCYYADWDDDGRGHGLVVLEDLVERGGTFGHSTQLPGPDGVSSALEGLAKFHGSLWDSPILDQNPWLQVSMRTRVDCDQVRIMWQWIEENLKDPKFRAIAPQHYLDDPRKVERALDNLSLYEQAFDAPYCILLGDCHQGNTFILPSGERLWLDWQLGRKGRPWRDLTYFMVGALTVEERRAHQKDLLAHYREHLIATGAQGVISLDEIWEQYRRWVMYGIQAWVANSDSWGQNGLPMNERFFTAAEDLGTWGLLGC